MHVPNLIPWISTRSKEETDTARQTAWMAIALAGKPTYEGTVPAHVKARRRAKNKAARLARRAARR